MVFTNKILMIGYGSVAETTLPLIFRHINIPFSHVTVVDFENKQTALKEWTDKGVNYFQEKITKPTLELILSKYVGMGDIIIDLAWNIGAEDILSWAHNHGVMYINTSTELWDPYTNHEKKHPTERTLYHRHMGIRKMIKDWKIKGPTAVIEHGANPGLISHFVKQGLLDIADAVIKEKKFGVKKIKLIQQLATQRSFAQLAEALEVKVIHVSERDTQISSSPKQLNEFVNTWSVEGFREEGTTTTELGWGTHEKELPPLTFEHKEGPKNQICLARMGMNTHVVSWVPNHTIQAMVIRHGEAFTLSDYLTVWDKKTPMYRPTVHYAYCPSDAAIASLHELRGRDYVLQDSVRIMKDDIVEGEDILGALIMGHPFQSWWIGSKLSIHEARQLVPHQNATTIQVAISIILALLWMMQHPNEGVLTPEALPHEDILRVAKPYLGQFISTRSDWTPLKHYHNAFKGYNTPNINEKDVWQFKNFLITDMD